MIRKSRDIQLILRLAPFVKTYKLWAIVSVIASIVISVLNVLNANVMKNVTDLALKGDWFRVTTFGIYDLVIVIVAFLAGHLSTYGIGRFSARMGNDLKKSLVRHISQLSTAYLEMQHTGDLLSRLTNDMNNIQRFIGNWSRILYQFCVFVGTFVYLLVVNWKLALACVIVSPIVTAIAMTLSRFIFTNSEEIQQQLGQASALTQDVIGGIFTVKSFNLQGRLYDQLASIVHSTVLKGIEIKKRQSLIGVIIDFFTRVPNYLLIVVAGFLALHGQMTAGEVVAISSLLVYMFVPLLAISSFFSHSRQCLPSIARVMDVFDQMVEVSGTKVTGNQTSIFVEFKNVSFCYDPGTPVLDDLSFKLRTGETVALVGESGSGKSSIVKILCGFYQPQKGEVRIYDRAFVEWELDALRSNISVVNQDTYLFPVSIAENIQYGNTDATLDQIVKAAKQANAHDFIMELPQGYHTIVGERGSLLSGGQRQRVAIARAFLKNSPIVLLDEPTSSLDSEAESKVQQALERLASGRSTLIIAHRLSSIRHANEILVLNEGRITERGTHEKLITEGGQYQSLYTAQRSTHGVETPIREGGAVDDESKK